MVVILIMLVQKAKQILQKTRAQSQAKECRHILESSEIRTIRTVGGPISQLINQNNRLTSN